MFFLPSLFPASLHTIDLHKTRFEYVFNAFLPQSIFYAFQTNSEQALAPACWHYNCHPIITKLQCRNFSTRPSKPPETFNLTLFCLCPVSFSESWHSVGTLIEAAKSGSVSRFIGRSRSEDSVCNSPNNRNESASHSNSPNSDEAVTESPTDSNPSLDKPDVDHKHHLQQHSSSHHPSDQQRNNSNVNSPQSHNNSNKKEHHHLHMHLNFGALAALKRKRKKFSNSRNDSPVLEPPPEHSSPTSNLKKSIKKVITVLNLQFHI